MSRLRWSLIALSIMVGGTGRLPAEDSQPVLSGRLLYSRLTDGTWQVWQRDLSTNQRVQVTLTPGDKRYPAWVLDGGIAYCTSNQACFQVHSGDERNEPLLADLWPVRDVAGSPDGRSLAFSRFRTELVDSANLWIADSAGTQRRILTQDAGIQEDAAWSPDGEQLAFAAGQGPGTYEIYLVNADGTNRRQLTRNRANDFLPAWSPDGTQIAFSSDASGDYEIWIMRTDGSDLRQLTHSPGLDTRPAWSPDGGHLAFATNRTGTLAIWVMNTDGADQRSLEQAEGGSCDPAWR
jgi:Tol biopolymer transport system component